MTMRSEKQGTRNKNSGNPFLFLASCFLLLVSTACGFHPMYGAQRTTSPSLTNVRVGIIADAPGQQLRNKLLDRMPPTVAAPRYQLAITLAEGQTGIAIANDATITRQQLRTTLKASLTDSQTQTIVWKQELFATSGYNVLESQFSTLVGQQDARQRNIDDLANRLVNLLAMYFDKS